MIDRLFHILGLDWHQFKTLFVISIRMDFRMQRGSVEQGKKRSPLLRSMIIYGLMSLFLSTSLAPRVTLSFFSFLMITYSMVMVMFAVILEFGNIIIHTEDADILLHRPINSRTYFLAKYCNFLFYVGLMSVASCFFPSLIGLFIQGATLFFPITFLSVTLIANITAASFIIWIYTGLLKMMKYERFKDIIVYVQMGFAFIILLTYQFIPRVSDESIGHSFEVSGKWFYFIPSVWYTGLIQILTGNGDRIYQHVAFIGLTVTFVLIFLSFQKISLQYACLISDIGASSEPLSMKTKQKISLSRTVFSRSWIKKVLQYSESIAAFYLTSHMIRRDRFVKMSVYPVIGIPFALMVFAIIRNRIFDPFVTRSVLELDSSLSRVVFFIFFMIYFLILSMVNSRDWEASWLFHIVPLYAPGRLYRGVRLAILLYLILPFFILFGIVYCVQVPWIHGIQYTFSLFLLALVCSSICMFTVKDYPFSVKREKGGRIQRFSFLIIIIPFFILYLLVQKIAYQSYSTWWITQLGLLVLFIVLEVISEKRLSHRFRFKEMLA